MDRPRAAVLILLPTHNGWPITAMEPARAAGDRVPAGGAGGDRIPGLAAGPHHALGAYRPAWGRPRPEHCWQARCGDRGAGKDRPVGSGEADPAQRAGRGAGHPCAGRAAGAGTSRCGSDGTRSSARRGGLVMVRTLRDGLADAAPCPGCEESCAGARSIGPGAIVSRPRSGRGWRRRSARRPLRRIRSACRCGCRARSAVHRGCRSR